MNYFKKLEIRKIKISLLIYDQVHVWRFAVDFKQLHVRVINDGCKNKWVDCHIWYVFEESFNSGL